MIRQEKRTTDEIIQKLGDLRQQLNQGSITELRFTMILGYYFRFTDDRGRLWTPGANSDRWYMWDRGRWTAGNPPAVLNLPTVMEQPKVISPQAPRVSGPKFCRSCGKPLSEGSKFCPSCGTMVRPQ